MAVPFSYKDKLWWNNGINKVIIFSLTITTKFNLNRPNLQNFSVIYVNALLASPSEILDLPLIPELAIE